MPSSLASATVSTGSSVRHKAHPIKQARRTKCGVNRLGKNTDAAGIGRSGSVSRILSTHTRVVWSFFSQTRKGTVLCVVQSATNTRGSLGGQGDPPPICLASRGAYHAVAVTRNAVGSYSTISPLPTTGGIFSVVLSVTIA